jgi:hypothetical protein
MRSGARESFRAFPLDATSRGGDVLAIVTI